MPDPAHLLMLAAAAVTAITAQLAGTDITIELAEDAAVVEARYALDEPLDSLRLSLIHIPDQDIEPLSAEETRQAIQWEERPGLTWVTVTTADERRSAARLRYRVTGILTRIPIPVPEVPAEPGRETVTLTVRGLHPSARLLEGFPRLVLALDGSAVARLDNVPGFFRRPPAGKAWSVNRGAQWFVVLLVAGASVAWAVRGRQRRRAGTK